MTLNELGTRICIMGPSNSGKSTLAEAIAKVRGLQVVHLDQLHHLPHTDWVPRPPAEFAALHDAAIAGDRWVMDGHSTARAALDRIEKRLAVGASLAALVDECIKAGHITAAEAESNG